MKIVRALGVALALGMTACSTLELSTDHDPGADFTKYKTFSFKPGAKPRNAVAARSVEYAIGQALEGKGLKNKEAGGDLLVYSHFVLDEKVQIETYGYGMVGWYGYGWGPTVTTERRIPVGTVVIDLVDPVANNLVWRGVVKDEISTSLYPEEREQKAITIAKQLFADFPPATKKK